MGADAAGARGRNRRAGVESSWLGAPHGKDSPRPASPAQSRLHKTAEQGPTVPEAYLYKVVDALDTLSAETGKSVPQLALNWLLRKPTISSVIMGARNEQQLRDNLDAANFVLTAAQVARLDEASETEPPYPYWHQRQNYNLNPAAAVLPRVRLQGFVARIIGDGPGASMVRTFTNPADFNHSPISFTE